MAVFSFFSSGSKQNEKLRRYTFNVISCSCWRLTLSVACPFSTFAMFFKTDMCRHFSETLAMSQKLTSENMLGERTNLCAVSLDNIFGRECKGKSSTILKVAFDGSIIINDNYHIRHMFAKQKC